MRVVDTFWALFEIRAFKSIILPTEQFLNLKLVFDVSYTYGGAHNRHYVKGRYSRRFRGYVQPYSSSWFRMVCLYINTILRCNCLHVPFTPHFGSLHENTLIRGRCTKISSVFPGGEQRYSHVSFAECVHL